MKVRCAYCKKMAERRECDVVRARKAGLNIYCNHAYPVATHKR